MLKYLTDIIKSKLLRLKILVSVMVDEYWWNTTLYNKVINHFI